MKITVITVAKNEQTLLPFFLRHYNFADEILLYDNQSSDATVSIARASPKVKVLNLYTCDQYQDSMLLAMKSQIYRVLPGDWFIMVDIDEFVWHPDGIRPYLEMCSGGGCTLPQVRGFDMIGTEVPSDDGASSLLDIIKIGVHNPLYSKRVLVHKDVEINYRPGCHQCMPLGHATAWPQTEVKLLHYKWLSEDYVLSRAEDRLCNMSVENQLTGWGKEDLGTLQRYYREALKRAEDVFTVA